MTEDRSDPDSTLPAVVGDGSLPVPVRYRHDGWTPERQRAFIEHLADNGSVGDAAALVGMTEQSAARLRRRPGAEAFSAASDAALRHGIGRLVTGLFDRALNGKIVRRYYHGKLIAEERVHSERPMIYLLEKADRLLGRSPGAEQILEDWDGWMDRLESGAGDDPRYRLWEDEHGNWLTDRPPPLGFDGLSEGRPSHAGYWRSLTGDELKAAEAQRRVKQAACPEPDRAPNVRRGQKRD